MAVQYKRLTESGAITAAGTPIRVVAVSLSPGANAATLQLLDGGSGGTEVMDLEAPTSGLTVSAQIPEGGGLFGQGCYATITGATSKVTVWYELG